MSLIHEALKKAEEQRRLGQPPDLASPFARPRERTTLLPFLLVAIVIAGGAGWWLLRTPATTANNKPAANAAATPAANASADAARKPDAVTAAGLERTAARSSSAERLPVAAPPPAPPPVAAPMPNTVAPKAAAPATAPGAAKIAGGEAPASQNSNPAPAGEKVIALNAPGAQPDQEALAKAMNQAATNVAATTTPLNTATKPAGVAKVDKVPMPDTGPALKPAAPNAAPPTPATKPLASSAPAGTPPAPATNAPAPATAPGAKKAELPDSEPVTGPAMNPPPAAAPTAAKPADNLPLFWQLPYNVRKDLPQLAVTMHVFAADPGQRFVVINGDRKAEGDTLGADVVLREIRNDGIVLEFRGQRFLVPRGGS